MSKERRPWVDDRVPMSCRVPRRQLGPHMVLECQVHMHGLSSVSSEQRHSMELASGEGCGVEVWGQGAVWGPFPSARGSPIIISFCKASLKLFRYPVPEQKSFPV